MKRYGLSALLGALLGAALVFPREAFWAAREGLSVFGLSVLPALLPPLFLLLLLSSRMRGGRAAIFLTAMLCGSPGGARLLAPRCGNKKDALFCAGLTGTMSPMFFLGTLSVWTGDAALARALYGVHIAAAALCGLPFLRRGMLKEGMKTAPLSIGEAALDTARAMLIACVCVCTGCVARAMLSAALACLPPLALSLLGALLESAGGVGALCALRLPRGVLAHLVSFVCAFGGLSIQAQNAAFLSKSGVKSGELCLLGLLRGALALLLCLLVFGMRP